MPYITNAEQGRPDPTQQIQGAAQAMIQQQLLRQQMGQSAQAFPLEQQQRQATADEATATAGTIRQRLALQLQAQSIQNQLSQTQLDFQKETDPTRKQMLGAQLADLNGKISQIGFQSKLLEAQASEASSRGNLFQSEADKANPGLSPYDVSETAGKPDGYGNIPITKTYTDKSGKVVHTEQSILQGRGQPRAVYKSEFDPESGQMKRVAGVLQEDPQTGQMEAKFPDETGAPQGQPQRNAVTDALVSKYFDPATGQPKSGGIMGMGSGTITPATVGDRAALRQLLSNQQLVSEYGLNAYKNLNASLGAAGAQAAVPAQGQGATDAVKPSSSTSASGNQDDMTRTGDSGPSGAVSSPNLTAPQDSPAGGVATGGGAVKTGNVPASGAPTGPVPIMSGRTGAQQQVSAPAATSAAKPGKNSQKKFTDLNVNDFFMQNGVRYQKTGPKSAQPAPDTSGPAAVSPGQVPSLPSAQGM